MEWRRQSLARWNDEVERRAKLSVEGTNQPTAPGATLEAGGPPVPSTTIGVLTAAQVASYARAAGFPEDVIPVMVAIAARESGFDPAAVNPSSGACGLWQMYPCPGPEALNPATNAAMAYAKYAASGLSPWGM